MWTFATNLQRFEFLCLFTLCGVSSRGCRCQPICNVWISVSISEILLSRFLVCQSMLGIKCFVEETSSVTCIAAFNPAVVCVLESWRVRFFIVVLLRSEMPSGMCAKLRTVAACNNRVHMPWSLCYCLFAPHICMVLFFAHIPFVVNHTINATPPERLQQHLLLFTTNHTDRTFFCVKAELRTTSTSWSQHHFDAIGNPERHVRKASHHGSKQQ